MTIGELVMLLKFQVDATQLDNLGKQIDAITAKAKGLAGAFKDAGLVPSGGGRAGGGANAGGTSRLTGGVQDRTHVDLWRWNQRQEAERQKEAAKLQSERKSAFNQQLQWQRRLVEVSTKLTIGLAALNTGLLAIVENGRRTAVGFAGFSLGTGISAQTLQRFQQVGSRYDVSPESMANALQALAKVRRDAAWGQADFGALNALGLNANQSPEKMLLALQARGSAFNRMGGADQTAFLARLGLDGNIQQFLARTHGNLGNEVAAIDDSLLLNGEGQQRIMAMDRAFGQMWQNLRNLGLQLSDFASRYLKPIWEQMDGGIQRLTKFFTWLNSGAEGANTLRTALYGVATALVAVTSAMTALSALAGFRLLATLIGSLAGGGSVAAGLGLGGAGVAAAGSAGAGGLTGLAAFLPEIIAAVIAAGAIYGIFKLVQANASGDPYASDPMKGGFFNPSIGTGTTHQNYTLNMQVDGGDPQKITRHLEDFFTGKLRTATANMPQYAPP